MIHKAYMPVYKCNVSGIRVSNGRLSGSGGQGVGLQGPKGAKGRPSKSQGVKV